MRAAQESAVHADARSFLFQQKNTESTALFCDDVRLVNAPYLSFPGAVLRCKSDMLQNKYFPIRFTQHALDSARKRGTNQKEIRLTVQEAPWRAAKLGRMEAEMEFPYDSYWNNQYYQSKKVNPVFILENKAIIVITAYCFYYQAYEDQVRQNN